MAKRRSRAWLPDIIPCPFGQKHAYLANRPDDKWTYVTCPCGWFGPQQESKLAAILAWNCHDAERARYAGFRQAIGALEEKFPEAASYLRQRIIMGGEIEGQPSSPHVLEEFAEWRGAMKVAQWLADEGFAADENGDVLIADELRSAIGRGLVVPKSESHAWLTSAQGLWIGAPLQVKMNSGKWKTAYVDRPVEISLTDGPCTFEVRLDQEGQDWRFPTTPEYTQPSTRTRKRPRQRKRHGT